MKTIPVKSLALTLCAILLLSMLAACGGKNEPSAGSGSDYEPEATADYEPESGDVSVVVAETTDAIPMGYDSGFVIDLPAGYRYDDAWSCYLSPDNAVRMWVSDANFYETENEFLNALEEYEGSLKELELDGILPAWIYEDPAGFYGAEAHYYISLGEYYQGKSGCHLIVSNESGDMASTQTPVIMDSLKTIRTEDEAAGERAAAWAALTADPYESLAISFTGAETAAMSTFMSGGRYAAEGNSVFGQAFDASGTEELVRIDLKENGSFAEVDTHIVLDKGVFPSYVTLCGNDVYYIRNGEGAYKVPKDGGSPQVVAPEAVNYLQIRGDKLYYCDEDYAFYEADLDGGNATPILDKEVYFPYFINDTWMIYQDDADDESLHLFHPISGEDITLCPIPTYSPIIYGTDLYCTTSTMDGLTLAKIDMTYTPDSWDNFSIEYGEKPEAADITISATGYLFYGLEDGLYIDRWKDAENADANYELIYNYLGEDYEIYWRYDDEGLISAIYVTLASSGGSRALPLLD